MIPVYKMGEFYLVDFIVSNKIVFFLCSYLHTRILFWICTVSLLMFQTITKPSDVILLTGFNCITYINVHFKAYMKIILKYNHTKLYNSINLLTLSLLVCMFSGKI